MKIKENLNTLDNIDCSKASPVMIDAKEVADEKKKEIKKRLKSEKIDMCDCGCMTTEFEIKEPEVVKTPQLKKLHLSEELEDLNEAFSPSMPQWLKNKLGYEAAAFGAHSRGTSTQKRIDTYKSRGYDFDEFDNGYNRPRNTLYALIHYYHVDLEHANFVPCNIPTSARDKITKKPNTLLFINIKYRKGGWYSDGDKAAVVVRYEGETLDGDSRLYINGEDVMVKWLSMKKLISMATDACYLDLNEPGNTYDINQKLDRKNAAARTETDRFKEYADSRQSTYWGSDFAPLRKYSDRNDRILFDKSGYAIINPAKYKKIVNERRANSGITAAADTLEKSYNILVGIKTELADFMANLDLKQIPDSSVFIGRDLLKKLVDLSNKYNEYSKMLIDLTTNPPEDEEGKERLQRLVGVSKNNGYINDLYSKVADLRTDIDASIEYVYDEKDFLDEGVLTSIANVAANNADTINKAKDKVNDVKAKVKDTKEKIDMNVKLAAGGAKDALDTAKLAVKKDASLANDKLYNSGITSLETKSKVQDAINDPGKAVIAPGIVKAADKAEKIGDFANKAGVIANSIHNRLGAKSAYSRKRSATKQEKERFNKEYKDIDLDSLK